MENKKLKIAIFTKDKMYAYKVRNKCVDIGYDAVYVKDLNSLFVYAVSNMGSVLLIDGKSSKLIKCIHEYAKLVNICRHKFIYLTDKNDIDIQVNNITCFSCSYMDLEEKINIINENCGRLILSPTTFWSGGQILSKIVGELDKYKISPNLHGYDYLRECLILVLESNCGISCFHTEIYPVVADRYKTTISNIEKNIRMAIKKAYTEYPEQFVFPNFNGKITNAKFIMLVAENIKEQLYQELS